MTLFDGGFFVFDFVVTKARMRATSFGDRSDAIAVPDVSSRRAMMKNFIYSSPSSGVIHEHVDLNSRKPSVSPDSTLSLSSERVIG